jgi:hypothetical protein
MVGVLAEEWKLHAVLVEDRASGESLAQELKGVTPRSSKVPWASSTCVWVPDGKKP